MYEWGHVATNNFRSQKLSQNCALIWLAELIAFVALKFAFLSKALLYYRSSRCCEDIMNNLAIRNSFMVLILTLLCMLTRTGTGATTLSSGKFADGKFVFIQEEISEPRQLRSLCLLHCGKETKVSPHNYTEITKHVVPRAWIHRIKLTLRAQFVKTPSWDRYRL